MNRTNQEGSEMGLEERDEMKRETAKGGEGGNKGDREKGR